MEGNEGLLGESMSETERQPYGQSHQERAHQVFVSLCQDLGLEPSIWSLGAESLRLLGESDVCPEGDLSEAIKTGPDRYAVEVKGPNYHWVYEVNASHSTLRPKSAIISLLSHSVLWTQAIMNGSEPQSKAEPLQGFGLISHTLLVSKNMQGLINLMAQFIKSSLNLDLVFVRIEPSDRGPIEACTGDDWRSDAFRDWLQDDQVKGLIARARSMRERGVSVQVNSDFASVVHIGYLADGPREIGFFALAGSGERPYDLAVEENISTQIAAVYDKARLEDKREARFMSMTHENDQMRQTNDAMMMDLHDLERKWLDIQQVQERHENLFRMLDLLRHLPRDQAYLAKILDFVRSLAGSNTATLCFSEIDGMYAIYLMKDRSLRSLAFSELDGGLYHDVLHSGQHYHWDGKNPRDFDVPSGHPRVRSCLAVPFDWEDFRGVIMAANLEGSVHADGVADSITKLIAMAQTDITLAYEQFKRADQ